MSFNDVMESLSGRKKRPETCELKDTHDLTLYDLNKWFDGAIVFGKMHPIIGNHSIRMLPTLLWGIQGKSVILRGEAGSGKTEIAHATITLMFGDLGLKGDNTALYLFDSASKEALKQESEVKILREASRCYIPEIQNAVDHIDMFKKWMEGLPHKKKVTVKRNTVKTVEVPPLPILCALAIGNETIKDVGPEVFRRASHLYTMSGEQQNERVHEMISENRFLPDEELPIMPPDRVELLRNKIYRAMREERRVINPYAQDVQMYLPKKFTSSNSFIHYFLDLIEAITKFNSENRYGTDKYLFSTLEDNYMAVYITGNIFPNMCLGLPDIGREVAELFPLVHEDSWGGDDGLVADTKRRLRDNDDYWTVGRVMKEMKANGFARDRTVTEDILLRLVEANILNVETEGRKNYYYRTAELDPVKTLNWEEIANNGFTRMCMFYPNDVDNWFYTERYLYTDYHTGEVRNIFKTDEVDT